jgi:hypothetical protein
MQASLELPALTTAVTSSEEVLERAHRWSLQSSQACRPRSLIGLAVAGGLGKDQAMGGGCRLVVLRAVRVAGSLSTGQSTEGRPVQSGTQDHMEEHAQPLSAAEQMVAGRRCWREAATRMLVVAGTLREEERQWLQEQTRACYDVTKQPLSWTWPVSWGSVMSSDRPAHHTKSAH